MKAEGTHLLEYPDKDAPGILLQNKIIEEPSQNAMKYTQRNNVAVFKKNYRIKEGHKKGGNNQWHRGNVYNGKQKGSKPHNPEVA